MGTRKTNLLTKEDHRNQLKRQIESDQFTTFIWDGVDSYDKCGCFMIAEKNSGLKFYNGGGFSNEYSKPLYSDYNGDLMGVTKKMQTIKFKVALYYFTIEEYQDFLQWLDPMKINYLSFGYMGDFSYLAKLNSISTESQRTILGKGSGENEYYYYTELDLTWDILNQNIVRSNEPYGWFYNDEVSSITPQEYNDKGACNIASPVVVNISLTDNTTTTDTETIISGEIIENRISREVFKIVFNKNLFIETDTTIQLTYDSEAGLLFLMNGDKNILLNYNTINSDGQSLVKTLWASKWKTANWVYNSDQKFPPVAIKIKINQQAIKPSLITMYGYKNIL